MQLPSLRDAILNDAKPQRDTRGAPGIDLIPQSERELFVEQFAKDAQFFQLFFLLLNRSCSIRNIDLVWVEHGVSGRRCIRRLGITEALARHGSRLLACGRQYAHPDFCSIISEHCRQRTEACSVFDAAAEKLIRLGGKTKVHRCHFGLIHIAVPVMTGGQHIATLFTGQVFREALSKEGFVQISKVVARLGCVDLRQLEQAYWRVPVAGDEDIRNTIEILEQFSDYIAHSWLRLAAAVRERRGRYRELRLARKEFAYHALEGGEGGRVGVGEMRELMRKIGFTRPPNRVMVVRFDAEKEHQAPAVPFEMSMAAARQSIEDACEKLDNVVAAHLPKTGTCVFFHEASAVSGRAGEFFAHRLATRMLEAIRSCCELPARIGVGGAKDDWCDLEQSYREACSALAASPSIVATYQQPSGSFGELSRKSEYVCRLVAERQLEEAKSAIRSLPGLVAHHLGSGSEGLTSARLFFCCALESLCFAARDLGCDTDAIMAAGGGANGEFQRAADILQLQEIWLRSADRVLEEIGLLYSGKRKKIVERACVMIDHHLRNGAPSPPLSISTIASAVGVSASHMSRIFKRVTGQTFESYLMTKRVEMAKRLLLDPLHNVSQVALRCGFSDASYFARVFRKITGCSPTNYCQDPLRHCSPRWAKGSEEDRQGIPIGGVPQFLRSRCCPPVRGFDPLAEGATDGALSSACSREISQRPGSECRPV